MVSELENELKKIEFTSKKTEQNDISLKQSAGYVQVESRDASSMVVDQYSSHQNLQVVAFTSNLQAQSSQENMTDAVSTQAPRRDVEKRALEQENAIDKLSEPTKKQRNG